MRQALGGEPLSWSAFLAHVEPPRRPDAAIHFARRSSGCGGGSLLRRKAAAPGVSLNCQMAQVRLRRPRRERGPQRLPANAAPRPLVRGAQRPEVGVAGSAPRRQHGPSRPDRRLKVERGALVALQPQHFSTRGDFPQAHVALAAARAEPLAVGRESNPEDHAFLDAVNREVASRGVLRADGPAA